MLRDSVLQNEKNVSKNVAKIHGKVKISSEKA